MRGLLLDTNVISEITRPSRDPHVERFLGLYEDHILPLAAREAWAAAILRAEAERADRALHLADALIAGTAQAHSLTIATRNIDDFQGLGLALHNPWQG